MVPAVRLGIVGLALATAVIHIILAIPLTMVPFYLNGLGYIGLATVLYLPALAGYRKLVRWALMGFTALTIVLWALVGQPYTTIGYVDKAIEVALLALLWIDHRRSGRAAPGP